MPSNIETIIEGIPQPSDIILPGNALFQTMYDPVNVTEGVMLIRCNPQDTSTQVFLIDKEHAMDLTDDVSLFDDLGEENMITQLASGEECSIKTELSSGEEMELMILHRMLMSVN